MRLKIEHHTLPTLITDDVPKIIDMTKLPSVLLHIILFHGGTYKNYGFTVSRTI